MHQCDSQQEEHKLDEEGRFGINLRQVKNNGKDSTKVLVMQMVD